MLSGHVTRINAMNGDFEVGRAQCTAESGIIAKIAANVNDANVDKMLQMLNTRLAKHKRNTNGYNTKRKFPRYAPCNCENGVPLCTPPDYANKVALVSLHCITQRHNKVGNAVISFTAWQRVDI